VIAEAGFETTDRATQRSDRLARLAAAHGLPVRALHGPFLVLTKRVFGLDPRSKVTRSVALAEALGAPLVVTHAPYRWQLGYGDWLAAEIDRVRTERGVTVTVENMFPVLVGQRRLGFHTGMDLAELRRFHHLTLDTSHLAAAGQDLLGAWRAIGDLVSHVHASDNAGLGRDSHLPLGQGAVPAAGFLEELAAGGYSGDVTLEVNFRPLLGDRRKLVSAMRQQAELARHHLSMGLRRAQATRA
jgi:sugar phosphate isomerase/epimerase